MAARHFLLSRLVLAAIPLIAQYALAQDTAAPEAEVPAFASIPGLQPVEAAATLSNDRIMGVIPNFQTVSDPNQKVARLTVRQKFTLFVKETVDPYTFASAGMGAGMSQYGDKTPKYGTGLEAYSERVGAAFADIATQNFFADAVLASILHEDPRYFRLGPEYSIPRRLFYSFSRLFITRTDSGGERFNFSNVGGTAMGIALSNAYYPDKSVSGAVTEGRFISSLSAAAIGNLLPEFWPDVKEKFAHWRRK
jgi:hypothetical protein